MANNFRYLASYNRVFVHQLHGNDANDGLTPETPKKTLGGARAVMSTTRNELIASGHFLNELFGTLPNGSLIKGDGICIIEYPNNSTELYSGNVTVTFINVILRNINKLLVLTSNFAPCFQNCVVENVNGNTNNAGTINVSITNSTFYNSIFNFSNSTSNTILFSGNKFFNCSIKAISNPNYTVLMYNYFNKATLLEISAISDGSIGKWNNYECKFKYQSTYYDTLADLVTAYPALNNTEGNRSDTVTFNKPEYGDYTVPSNSPLLNTSLWNNTVCGNAFEGVGNYWSDGVTNWTISQSGSTDDLEVVSGVLQLASGKTVGTITRNSDSQLDIGSLKTLKFLKFLGNLSFNNTGINAPAIYSYNSGDAGYNPIRLTVQLKYSPTSLTQAQWDALNWYTFDLGSEVKMDGTYGNGNPSYDFTLPAHLGNIKARYYLVKITLRSAL